MIAVILRGENRPSPTDCDTASNPTNAHGTSATTMSTPGNAALSGLNAGIRLSSATDGLVIIMAPTKQAIAKRPIANTIWICPAR